MADETEDKPVEVDEDGEAVEKTDEAPQPETKSEKSFGPNDSKWSRFKNWYRSDKRKSIPLTVLAVIVLLLLVPPTRYVVAGTVYKKNFGVTVTDSKTHTPVSGATISSGSTTAETGGDGKAYIRLSVGHHTLSITKKYYSDQTVGVTVPLLSQKDIPSIDFEATGRQVKITVTNTFTNQPLANVDIKLADADAKTDSTGSAIAVVPESTKEAKATLSLDGYNKTEKSIQASDSEIKQNDLTLTPAGKLYFLSKLSGKIDVIKTDLDGQNRQTVLAGTGNEQDSNTVLLASRDWHYLALLSRRDNSDPKLYLIDTSNDKHSVIDEGQATFTPIGWDDNNFLFQVDRTKVPAWQSGHSVIKSFNATSRQLLQLDSTQVSTKNKYYYATETYDYGGRGFYLIDHNLIYDKTWDNSNGDLPNLVAGKKNTIQKIGTNGSNHQTLLSYGIDKYIESFLFKPRNIYYHQTVNDLYYAYRNGSINQDQSIKDDYQKYEDNYVANTYLLSPDGQQTFWYEQRDGKNTLLLGDVDAGHSQTVGRDEKLIPYGWYTNDYLLLSKDSDELYILPKTGTSDKVKPFKISDYHKPARSFYGYGGGYGGL